MNHENTKSKKHEMLRNVFVFLFFRDFVMEVFDSTLDVDYWIFENNKVITFDQDLTKEILDKINWIDRMIRISSWTMNYSRHWIK